jgi:hypothetical protein
MCNVRAIERALSRIRRDLKTGLFSLFRGLEPLAA